MGEQHGEEDRAGLAERLGLRIRVREEVGERGDLEPALARAADRRAAAAPPCAALLVIDECGPRVNELATAEVGDLDEHRRVVAELLGDSKRVAADHYIYALTDSREVDRTIALARASTAG
jgi:hypothetical protein